MTTQEEQLEWISKGIQCADQTLHGRVVYVGKTSIAVQFTKEKDGSFDKFEQNYPLSDFPDTIFEVDDHVIFVAKAYRIPHKLARELWEKSVENKVEPERKYTKPPADGIIRI